MTTVPSTHYRRFPSGEDPAIKAIVRLPWKERNTSCLAAYVEHGLNVLDLLIEPMFFQDHREKPDVVALLKTALRFVTAEGLNSTVETGFKGGRLSVWFCIVAELESLSDVTLVIELLRDAEAAFDGFTDDDDEEYADLLEGRSMAEIRRVGCRQRVERERLTLAAAVESVEGTTPSARRKRL
ncbi:hypothetical protein [Paraburkholderia sp. C35]|uniref:hypothetical protein n=1 Tax=Paraburkholderia sp. C35 TaxID=2126993 RepID=UPI000D686608|nr:hypothetical protein [Paraburkholderia sp. C35]